MEANPPLKKLCRNTNSGNTSMEEKESSGVFIPEEIMSDIIVRMGEKALFRNKCVSKEWNSIISDPKLATRYMKRTKSPSSSSNHFLWGFLPRSVAAASSSSTTAPIDDQVPSLYLPDGNNHVLASSNGLVLCGKYPDYIHKFKPSRLCVCNPLTKQSIALPCIPKFARARGIICFATRLVQNSPASVSYKVVIILKTMLRRDGLDLGDRLITIYSSDTGRWSDQEIKVSNCPAIVTGSRPSSCTSSGVLRWFDFRDRSLVTYDPYGSPDRFGRMELPIQGNLGVGLIQLGEEDAVMFGEFQDQGGANRRLIVWRWSGHTGWAPVQLCLITPEWVYSPKCSDYFCYLGADDEGCISREELVTGLSPRSLEADVPFALCPWACVGQDQDQDKDATQTASYTRVSHVWVSPRNTYTGFLDWHRLLKLDIHY